MFEFDEKSIKNLKTCHPDLQAIFNEVIKKTNCIVARGFVDELTQNDALSSGRTKLAWPDGKHNKIPSMSVDVYPASVCLHPKDIYESNISIHIMRDFATTVLGIGEKLQSEGKITHEIVWGAGWDEISQYNFLDYAHFELRKK